MYESYLLVCCTASSSEPKTFLIIVNEVCGMCNTGYLSHNTGFVKWAPSWPLWRQKKLKIKLLGKKHTAVEFNVLPWTISKVQVITKYN